MGKWYKTGFKDALDGIFDPPWQEGHRDHTSYCEGHTDGERQAERDAEDLSAELDRDAVARRTRSLRLQPNIFR